MKKDIRKTIFKGSIAITVATVIVTFFPWMEYREHTYTIIGFYQAVNKAGSITAFAQGDSNVCPAFVVLAIPLIVAGVGAIKALVQALGRPWRLIGTIYYILEGTYMVLLLSFYGWDPTIWNLVAGFFVLADFLISRILADYNLITNNNQALKRKHQEEKLERKARLYFPGKYASRLQRLLLLSVEGNRRNQILLILVGAVTTSYTFSLMALSRSLKAVHSEEMLFLGNGMEASLVNALFVALILDFVVMSLVISRVLSAREKSDYRLIKLGAREELIRRSWFLEMAFCYGMSLVFGIILGILEVLLLLQKASSQMGKKMPLTVGVMPILAVIGIMAIIYLAVSLWNHERSIQKRYYDLRKRGAEYIPSKKVWMPLLVIGVGISIYCIIQQIQRRNFENIKLYIGLIAGVSMMVTAWKASDVQRPRAASKAYARTLWTYRFRRSMEMVLIVFAMGAMITVPVLQNSFIASANKESTESLFPYDFVAFGHEADRKYFYRIQNDCEDMMEIPMVRVTAVEGEPFDWKDSLNNASLKVIWPQGQNIGISWSSYKKLCKAQGLKVQSSAPAGEEILVAYQQDQAEKSHPIDYYIFRTAPFLRIGQPLRHYHSEDRKYLYPQRSVRKEFNQNLIGMLNRGNQENLVVFSDEYFKTLKTEEGPSSLYLITAKSGADEDANTESYQRIRTVLNKVAKINSADASFDREIQSYYEKKTMVSDTKTERYFQEIMLLYEVLMMFICVGLILLMYSGFLEQELVKKYKLLRKLGIPSEMQRKSLRKELESIYLLALGFIIIVSAIYTSSILFLREIPLAKVPGILIGALPLWIIQIAMIVGVLWIMYRRIWKRTTEGGK